MITQKNRNDEHNYFDDIYRDFKNNHIRIPINSYIMATLTAIKLNVKEILKKIIPQTVRDKIRGRDERNSIDEEW